MRFKWIVAAAFAAAIAAGPSYAEHIDVDLHDFDEELMKSLDQAFKYFDPDLSAGNVSSATEEEATIRYVFQWTKAYFGKRDSGEKAVGLAQQGLDMLDAVDKAVAEKNFDAASDRAHDLSQTCKACHDLYKPLKARS